MRSQISVSHAISQNLPERVPWNITVNSSSSPLVRIHGLKQTESSSLYSLHELFQISHYKSHFSKILQTQQCCLCEETFSFGYTINNSWESLSLKGCWLLPSFIFVLVFEDFMTSSRSNLPIPHVRSITHGYTADILNQKNLL